LKLHEEVMGYLVFNHRSQKYLLKPQALVVECLKRREIVKNEKNSDRSFNPTASVCG